MDVCLTKTHKWVYMLSHGCNIIYHSIIHSMSCIYFHIEWNICDAPNDVYDVQLSYSYTVFTGHVGSYVSTVYMCHCKYISIWPMAIHIDSTRIEACCIRFSRISFDVFVYTLPYIHYVASGVCDCFQFKAWAKLYNWNNHEPPNTVWLMQERRDSIVNALELRLAIDRLVRKEVTPFLTHWSCVSLSLTHRYTTWGPFYRQRLTQIRAGIRNCTCGFRWDVNVFLCLNFNGSLT